MENILVSACLIGVHCRYDGKCQDIEHFNEKLLQLMEKYKLIPVCPEVYGGLPTPRIPAEIVSGNLKVAHNQSLSCVHENALSKRNVINKAGVDVTAQFEAGAKEACYLAKLYNCKYAILKKRSPSCGNGQIYDGTFSKTLVDGDGITTAALKAQGIIVFDEDSCGELLNCDLSGC